MKNVGLKNNAQDLRSKGYSFAEIAERLGIAKSTASLWTRNVFLEPESRERLLLLRKQARSRSQQTQRARHELSLETLRDNVRLYLNSIQLKDMQRLICAMIYWCEGSKTDRRVTFTNSDPALVRYFLHLLRTSFSLDENKFRVVIHLHEYHDENVQRAFWSSVTGIEESQFLQVYRKPHTGKNKRMNYPGCVSVRYYDTRVVDYMMTLAQLAMNS